jgi:hypothetical protein
MLDPTARTALARIEAALARIEAVARRPASTSSDGESRYQALRQRTQAALVSLETVIAQVGNSGGRR